MQAPDEQAQEPIHPKTPSEASKANSVNSESETVNNVEFMMDLIIRCNRAGIRNFLQKQDLYTVEREARKRQALRRAAGGISKGKSAKKASKNAQIKEGGGKKHSDYESQGNEEEENGADHGDHSSDDEAGAGRHGDRRSQSGFEEDEDEDRTVNRRNGQNLDDGGDDMSGRDGSQFGYNGRISSKHLQGRHTEQLSMEERIERIEQGMDEVERDIYEHMYDDFDDLENGYSTISSTDSAELYPSREIKTKEKVDKVIDKQQKIKEQLEERYKKLQEMQKKQQQIRMAEQITAQLSQKNLAEKLKLDSNQSLLTDMVLMNLTGNQRLKLEQQRLLLQKGGKLGKGLADIAAGQQLTFEQLILDARGQKHLKNLDSKQVLSLLDFQNNSRAFGDHADPSLVKDHPMLVDDQFIKLDAQGKKFEQVGHKRNGSEFDFLKQHLGGDDQISMETGKNQASNSIAIGSLDILLDNERFREYKNKNAITIKPLSEDQIEFYRIQEAERYKQPQKPWIYFNEDGSSSIVGPVAKKNKNGLQISLNNKPRDHPQLLSNRPGIVTLLCLARDAASRLPDGVGTRADILELIKHSQWLKTEGIDSAQLNNIVSGALDRLHYEQDPCVKYDSDRKLWIYLHRERQIDNAIWDANTTKDLGQIQKPSDVVWPNCVQLNSISFETLRKCEKFNSFEAIMTPEHIANWKESIHREKNTEEIEKQMEDIKKKLSELEAQRQLELQKEKEAQILSKEQSRMIQKEIQLITQPLPPQQKEQQKQAIISQDMLLDAPIALQKSHPPQPADKIKAEKEPKLPKKEKKTKEMKAAEKEREKLEQKRRREREKEQAKLFKKSLKEQKEREKQMKSPKKGKPGKDNQEDQGGSKGKQSLGQSPSMNIDLMALASKPHESLNQLVGQCTEKLNINLNSVTDKQQSSAVLDGGTQRQQRRQNKEKGIVTIKTSGRQSSSHGTGKGGPDTQKNQRGESQAQKDTGGAAQELRNSEQATAHGGRGGHSGKSEGRGPSKQQQKKQEKEQRKRGRSDKNTTISLNLNQAGRNESGTQKGPSGSRQQSQNNKKHANDQPGSSSQKPGGSSATQNQHAQDHQLEVKNRARPSKDGGSLHFEELQARDQAGKDAGNKLIDFGKHGMPGAFSMQGLPPGSMLNQQFQMPMPVQLGQGHPMTLFGDENLFNQNPLLAARDLQHMMQLSGGNPQNSVLDFDEHIMGSAGISNGNLGIPLRKSTHQKMEQINQSSASSVILQNQKSKSNHGHQQNIPQNNGTNSGKNHHQTSKSAHSQNKHGNAESTKKKQSQGGGGSGHDLSHSQNTGSVSNQLSGSKRNMPDQFGQNFQGNNSNQFKHQKLIGELPQAHQFDPQKMQMLAAGQPGPHAATANQFMLHNMAKIMPFNQFSGADLAASGLLHHSSRMAMDPSSQSDPQQAFSGHFSSTLSGQNNQNQHQQQHMSQYFMFQKNFGAGSQAPGASASGLQLPPQFSHMPFMQVSAAHHLPAFQQQQQGNYQQNKDKQ